MEFISAEFDENPEEKPTVQVEILSLKNFDGSGLELMKDNSIISIQDMGPLA